MCASIPHSRVQGLDHRAGRRVMGSSKDSTEGTKLVEMASTWFGAFSSPVNGTAVVSEL